MDSTTPELLPSFASPREVQRKVRCQRSSRRTGQRGLAAGRPPPRAGLPAASPPPWGGATSRRYAWGSLLWPHPPPGAGGVRPAALAARMASFRPGEGSIVAASNPSRASLATLGGCTTLDGTCAASRERNHLAGKKPGDREDRASGKPAERRLVAERPGGRQRGSALG